MSDVLAMSTDEQVAYILGEDNNDEEEDHSKMSGKKLDGAKALELYHQGLSDNAIGQACGVTGSGIAYWRKKNGLAPNDHLNTPKKPASLQGRKPATVNPQFEAAVQEMVAGTRFEGTLAETELPVKLESLPPVDPQMTVKPDFEEAAKAMDKSARQCIDEKLSESELALMEIEAIVTGFARHSSNPGVRMAQLHLVKEIASEVV